MGLRSLTLIAVLWAGYASTGMAGAVDQCLSAAEIGEVARMASIMAIGVAVQRCRSCLSPQDYAQTLAKYESLGLLPDFWMAQKQFGAPGTAKSNYVDDIVRQSARLYSEKLGSQCDACSATAGVIDKLGSLDERDKLYRSEARALASSPLVKTCP